MEGISETYLVLQSTSHCSRWFSECIGYRTEQDQHKLGVRGLTLIAAYTPT